MIESSARDLQAAFTAVVDGFLATDYEALNPAELAELVTAREAERRRLEADDARLVSALAAQAPPARFGATSLPDLIGGLTRVTRTEARARAQRSVDIGPRRALSGEALPPIHPRTAGALRDGLISGAHVDVITRYLGRLPATVALESVTTPQGPRTVFDAAEDFLVTAAQHEDPGALRRSGDLLLARLDPDGAEPRDKELERRRWFTIGGRGGDEVHGTLTPETKAVWQAILDSLGAPQPVEDGTSDERTAGQRRHDAMLEAGLRLLRSGTLPECGGVPVTVVVRVDADDLAGAAAGASGGVAQTAHGDVVSVERFLRLADEADVVTVALTAHGEILDYGRTRRCASAAQRRALTARDGGCCFPRCDRPGAWTEVHHIRAWIRGGRTDLDNLCLLCAHHHRTFEAAGWVVEMVDGVPQWTPPAWLDPQQRRRTNTAHHLPEMTFAVA
ncbi:DUF222 domain-containing protein [uncultured Jatrophihabitans sp.]|uniref:HNH endonuclease n=1 Tax=uncultured Jatrophihabitans sp. TaxID=1610747 RepID=UPI0035CAA6C7